VNVRHVPLGEFNPYAPRGVPDCPLTVDEERRNISRALVCASVVLVATVALLAVVVWLLHVLSTT
jgi:hypothetical protein